MIVSGRAVRKINRAALSLGVLLAAALFTAVAQAQAPEQKSPAEGRVVVIGEASVSVAPDYAQIRSGIATGAKTVKEASDANAKAMNAITAALIDSGIAQKDIQTSQFSIEPIYASPPPPTGPKLTGYRVSNQVNVTIRQIEKAGEILDALVKAGATDAGNIAFLVSDPAKALDRAREAAVADARHKAELYARAAGVKLGRVAWISESAGYEPPLPMASAVARAKTLDAPIEPGEETLRARVSVGFDIAQ
jgi:uncharacterized protein